MLTSGTAASGSVQRHWHEVVVRLHSPVVVWQRLPESCVVGVQLARAREAEDRALVDLKFHFMHSTLDEVVRVPCCQACMPLQALRDITPAYGHAPMHYPRMHALPPSPQTQTHTKEGVVCFEARRLVRLLVWI